MAPLSQTPSGGSQGAFLAYLLAGVPLLSASAVLFGALGFALGAYLFFSRDLPLIPDLRAYRPKTVSTFYAEDGAVIGLFYREKRFPIPLDRIPTTLVNAFLAAEDSRFFAHPGIDPSGIARAALKNLQSGRFVQGGSTITQQVTRSFLLSREKKLSRKIREAILAYRLEQNLSKHEILELYLNEVYLGAGAYGVESAARTYFGKGCGELTLAESALLAGLASGPSKFSPTRNMQAALERRSFVLSAMLKTKFIAEDEYHAASAEPVRLQERLPNPAENAPYFVEAVRRRIIEKYGEELLYNDGLRVWTTCDVQMQKTAEQALMEGARAWERRQNRPAGLVARLKSDDVKAFLSDAAGTAHPKVGDLAQAVVIENLSRPKKDKKRRPEPMQECVMALRGGARFTLTLESALSYRPGDLLHFRITTVERDRLLLEQDRIPWIEGAVTAVENKTGYVRALVGGVAYERSEFNRAIQAKRRPGSAFKPMVYAAALEWGHYAPRTMLVDEPIAVVMGARETWVPMNSDGQFMGAVTFRRALELSRNTPTVKLAMDVGVEKAAEMAARMGITSPIPTHLSTALGTAETTPLELTAAYTVFPNMGVRIAPTLIKKIVDRFGRVLEDNTVTPLKADSVSVTAPEAMQWIERLRALSSAPETPEASPYFDRDPYSSPPPSPPPSPAQHPKHVTRIPAATPDSRVTSPEGNPRAERVMSPQTAYMMIGLLRGVCVTGTAAAAAKLKRWDLAGKTGTTDDGADAWFVGFTPRYTIGVWLGDDGNASLGRREYGGIAALPVWARIVKTMPPSSPDEAYPVPPGIAFTDLGEGPSDRHHPRGGLPELGPTLSPDLFVKQVSPIDVGVGPSSTAQVEWPGFDSPRQSPLGASAGGPYEWPEYAQSAYTGRMDYYPGIARLLSPKGDNLGYAPFGAAEKGKPTVDLQNAYRNVPSAAAPDDVSPVPPPWTRQPQWVDGEQERTPVPSSPRGPVPHALPGLPWGHRFEWGG